MGNGSRRRRSTVGLVAVVMVAILGATTVLGSARPAAACSCGGDDFSSYIESHDVGFIGTYQGSSDNPDPSGDGMDGRIATFTVSAWFEGDPTPHLDGDTVQIAAPFDGASCGFELRNGQEAAIFADRRGDRLNGGLCSTVDADVVRAYLAQGELPGGEAVLAVPGRFEGGGLALLDAEGTLVGYDKRYSFTSVPQVVSCPGGSTAMFIDDSRALMVDLVDLSIRREVPLGELLQESGLASVACRDPRGDRIDAVVERWQGDRSVYDLRSLDAVDQPGRTLDLPSSSRPTLAGDRVVAQTYLDPGERLVVIDPDGAERTVGELLPSADDDFPGYGWIAARPVEVGTGDDAAYGEPASVAVLESDHRRSEVGSRLWLLDPVTGREVVTRTIPAETSQVRWLDADRLLLIVGGEGPNRAEVLDAATLESIAAVTDWWDTNAVLVGNTLLASQGGLIAAGELGGERRELAALPTTEAGPIIALPTPIRVEPSTLDRPPVTVIEPTPAKPTSGAPAPDDATAAGSDGVEPSSGGLPVLPSAVAATVTVAAGAGLLVLRRRTGRGRGARLPPSR